MEKTSKEIREPGQLVSAVGEDRAQYGHQLFKDIFSSLKKGGLKTLRERHLYTCKDFYIAYPEILRTLSIKLHFKDNQSITILQTLFAKSETEEKTGVIHHADYDLLLNKLSFSHFIERMRRRVYLKKYLYLNTSSIYQAKNN